MTIINRFLIKQAEHGLATAYKSVNKILDIGKPLMAQNLKARGISSIKTKMLNINVPANTPDKVKIGTFIKTVSNPKLYFNTARAALNSARWLACKGLSKVIK